MSADTFRSLRGWLVFAVGANALTQFAVQAWLAYSFAAHVWGLPGPLPFGVPVALDVFVINLMVVTYALRGARLRTRIYVWAVLGFGVLAQVGAAEGFALHEGWNLWARAASMLPALFLAGSLHTLIIVANWTERAQRQEAREAARRPKREKSALWSFLHMPKKQADKPGQKADSAPARVVPTPAEGEPEADKVVSIGKARRKGGHGPAAHPGREAAVRRVLGGEEGAAVAREMGLNPRTVQLWVAKARAGAQRSGSPASASGGRADAPVPKDGATAEDRLQ